MSSSSLNSKEIVLSLFGFLTEKDLSKWPFLPVCPWTQGIQSFKKVGITWSRNEIYGFQDPHILPVGDKASYSGSDSRVHATSWKMAPTFATVANYCNYCTFAHYCLHTDTSLSLQ